ncbi:hypothetical protein N7457_003791 [Penicillium paradoxum]|uniref:uncharacterized protein n=1 Tax=Penicillium paradoxum TaxID=176176 RepID=UPI002548578D|nr:uncharacterized protein N7457_003791 [Penicillium paradoxum]KAJ5782017.1 hypothetical protein N7457_003791 [Penicillium paradoxum]
MSCPTPSSSCICSNLLLIGEQDIRKVNFTWLLYMQSIQLIHCIGTVTTHHLAASFYYYRCQFVLGFGPKLRSLRDIKYALRRPS